MKIIVNRIIPGSHQSVYMIMPHCIVVLKNSCNCKQLFQVIVKKYVFSYANTHVIFRNNFLSYFGGLGLFIES